MSDNLNLSTNISRYAFVFLIYVLVSAGYISQVLSCQMRRLLMTSLYFKHIFAIIMVFAFIMFEGGWDFDKAEEDKAPTNWASGNTVHTIIIAMIIYTIFLISSKSKLVPNLIFFGIMFMLYFVNTYRDYAHQRKYISDELNEKVLFLGQIIGILAFVVLFYGFVDYYLYQKADHPKDFSWITFMLGTSHCKSLLHVKD